MQIDNYLMTVDGRQGECLEELGERRRGDIARSGEDLPESDTVISTLIVITSHLVYSFILNLLSSRHFFKFVQFQSSVIKKGKVR